MDKPDIEYGDVEIPEETFEDKNVKIRVTMMIDMVIYRAFKAAAEKTGGKYQTMMNDVLKRAVPGLTGPTLEQQLMEQRMRIELLELGLKNVRELAGIMPKRRAG